GCVLSEADGSFRVGRLGEGVYELSTRARGNWLESEPIPVTSGAVGVAVVVRRGLLVTVAVQDPDGRPLESAHVVVRASGGRTASDLAEDEAPRGARSARRGKGVQIGPLDPSSPLALWVVPPKDRQDLVRKVIAPWTPSDTTVQLERGRLLTGIVRDPDGRPVPYARAEWRAADGDWVGTAAREDGRFALRGLPLGPVRVRARHRPAPVWGTAGDDRSATGPVSPEVEVEPARADVTLVVHTGSTLDVRLPTSFGDFTTIWLLLQAGDRFVPIEWRWMADRHAWAFRGLDPASTYAVYARTQEGRDVAWRANLRPGPGPVTLDRVVGLAIHVRVLAPPGAKPDVTVAMHGVPLPGERTSDGRWVVHHLLDGTWPVTATADVDGAKWTARADVPAGGSVELELKPAVR
ncbi:MAG TPA: carboxypeptidase-like regulatory domain-containing protein, partial [Planctomycetota bacterium]|nr:carboxypeptidase-like regulatory domain-containing protein [Planctomycetota bacterium]